MKSVRKSDSKTFPRSKQNNPPSKSGGDCIACPGLGSACLEVTHPNHKEKAKQTKKTDSPSLINNRNEVAGKIATPRIGEINSK